MQEKELHNTYKNFCIFDTKKGDIGSKKWIFFKIRLKKSMDLSMDLSGFIQNGFIHLANPVVRRKRYRRWGGGGEMACTPLSPGLFIGIILQLLNVSRVSISWKECNRTPIAAAKWGVGSWNTGIKNRLHSPFGSIKSSGGWRMAASTPLQFAHYAAVAEVRPTE